MSSLSSSSFMEDCSSYDPTTTYTATTTETFTTTYTYCNQAADATTVWEATYTIIEVVCGDMGAWTTPAVPPNFAETVVECNETPVTITCPVETSLHTGTVSICGNGVTATAGPMITATAGTGAWSNSTITTGGNATVSTPAQASSVTMIVTAGSTTLKSSLTLAGAAFLLISPFFL